MTSDLLILELLTVATINPSFRNKTHSCLAGFNLPNQQTPGEFQQEQREGLGLEGAHCRCPQDGWWDAT